VIRLISTTPMSTSTSAATKTARKARDPDTVAALFGLLGLSRPDSPSSFVERDVDLR
jgi:hypothetical protein